MKVTVTLGFTISKGGGDFIKPTVEMRDIDLDCDVDMQIKSAGKVIKKAFDNIFDIISKEIIELERP